MIGDVTGYDRRAKSATTGSPAAARQKSALIRPTSAQWRRRFSLFLLHRK
jgi:hypothetical protein